MLKKRVLTASILAPFAIACIVFLPLEAFMALMVVLTLSGLWEWTRFVPCRFRFSAFLVPALIVVASAIVLPLSVSGFTFHHLIDLTDFGISVIAVVGAVWWLLSILMIFKYPSGTKWWSKNRPLQQLFGLLTLLPFFWSVLLLRGYQYDDQPFLGAKLVLLVCMLVWAADTGAFFAGKKFGKRKMLPNVSPNKTIEGLIGGLAAGVAIMMIAAPLFAIPFTSTLMLALVALITSLASVLGDLVESMFKRVAGIKDSGRILPGHGGILDRIDGLTAAFPVFTVLYFWLV